MADFFYYGIWSDSLRILETLTSMQQFEFVLDIGYVKPTPLAFTSLGADALGAIGKPGQLFLKSNSFSEFPVSLSKPTDEGVMTIAPAISGPFLSLRLPAYFEINGRASVGLGWLRYQPRYYHPETREPLQTSESLRAEYIRVKKILLSLMTRRYALQAAPQKGAFQAKEELLWIGRDALILLESNEVGILIGPEWRWIQGKDLYKNSQKIL